jgi:hypothetical protein
VKLKQGTRIEITWDDSFRQNTGAAYWSAHDELDYEESEHMTTLGYFVRRSDRWTTIAQTIERDAGHDNSYGGVFTIPTPCIYKITKLERQ